MIEDKNVFITGGDKGIGYGIVERMATLCKQVIFTYNKNVQGAKAIELRHANVVSFQCDLKDREMCINLSNRILVEFGNIDILINNAGFDDDSSFIKMNINQWDDVLDVNLRSLFHFTSAFTSGMISNGWGRIVNLTSIAGFTGAFGKSNYAAAKAGVVGFTKSLALELAKKGITVNAIAPGAIKTDMLMRIPDKYQATILQNIPMARFGEVDEVADLTEFLVSDKSKYITGQTIHINGGSYL